MGTEITVFTVEKMQEIVDGAIVDAEILADDLVLHRHDGTDIDAGNVRGPKGDTGPPGADGGGGAWSVRQIAADYTLVLGDAFAYLEATNALDDTNTVTIPLEADVPFEDGTIIKFCQLGEGRWVVAGAGGVTVRSLGGYASAGQYAEFQMRKRSGDEWVLWGMLQA